MLAQTMLSSEGADVVTQFLWAFRFKSWPCQQALPFFEVTWPGIVEHAS